MKVTYIQHCGSDLQIVNAARVSFKKESMGDLAWVTSSEDGKWAKAVFVPTEKDQKLIKYLADHKHWTPFAHNSITLHIKAPIFVFRQLDKSQVGFVVNEVSRRYVDDEPEFYFPATWRKRPPGSIKQGSGEEVHLDWDVEPYVMDSLRAYDKLLESGVAPEMARMVLPQSMYTEQWKTGSLAAWARLYNLRTEDNVQKETQEIARQCGEILEPLFPFSWRALTDG